MLDWHHSVRNSPLREGVGETRFPHVPTAVGSGWHPLQAGGWGNRVSPVPNRWWERLAPPHRQGDGETGFPQFPTAGGSGWHPPQAGGWGNRVSPVPNRWWERLAPPTGRGAVRQAHRRWGNRVSPYVHIRHHSWGAQRQNENNILVPGRAAPSQTLPRAGYFHLSHDGYHSIRRGRY